MKKQTSKFDEGKKIIIAERDNIAAVVQSNKVSEFFINRGEILMGDVYLASVENILPSIDAAFLHVGYDKMGFLHAQDIIGKGALQDKLSPKQKLVVQVVKEPTGHKGPRVTTEISLPGRFLVLIPKETGINVSKKIESVKERARLKSLVNLLKPVGIGVIIRTEAENQSESDIQEDLEILLEKWNNIITSAESLEAPNLLYRDQDLLYRVIREACTEDVKEILVDTAFALNRVQSLLLNWHMNKNIQVNLYKGSEPLLIATNIHKEIKAALQTKVNMPSGGYLFIQQTEALTVVDVNSGKFVSSATQDETILKTNIEAVHEIARQLRLRNIGGMIIIDFIDMLSRVDKLAVMEELEIAIEPDKGKPQVGQLSDLGLVELTRHRQGQSLSEIFAKKCPHCQGMGYSMDEFKFSSPVAEGEYRAKAAKMKLPVSNFKKNNNYNGNRKPSNRPPYEQKEKVEKIENPENPSIVAQEEINQIKDEQTQQTNKKFGKSSQKEVARKPQIKTAESVVVNKDEIIPVIEKQKFKQETKVAKPAAKVINQPAKAEVKVEAKAAEIKTEIKPEAKEEAKKTRRPNRGIKNKPTERKTVDEEVKV